MRWLGLLAVLATGIRSFALPHPLNLQPEVSCVQLVDLAPEMAGFNTAIQQLPGQVESQTKHTLVEYGTVPFGERDKLTAMVWYIFDANKIEAAIKASYLNHCDRESLNTGAPGSCVRGTTDSASI